MTEPYKSCPKYYLECNPTEEQVASIVAKAMELASEDIANRAVDIAKEEFYKDVGKTVIKKFFLCVGIVSIALVLWAQEKGLLIGH